MKTTGLYSQHSSIAFLTVAECLSWDRQAETGEGLHFSPARVEKGDRREQ